MSTSLTDAVVLLTRARDRLLGESQAAGGHGNWTNAKILIELAERADRLREELSALTMSDEGWQNDEPERGPVGAKADATDQRRAKDHYPKYFVRGDNLVKRGLQRNARDVYEHAVPRDWYEKILDRLVQMSKS